MGWFVKEFFGASPMLAMPVLALVIFFGFWAVMTFRTMRMKKTTVDAVARLAIEGDGDHG